jgi:hypothetical protein
LLATLALAGCRSSWPSESRDAAGAFRAITAGSTGPAANWLLTPLSLTVRTQTPTAPITAPHRSEYDATRTSRRKRGSGQIQPNSE